MEQKLEKEEISILAGLISQSTTVDDISFDEKCEKLLQGYVRAKKFFQMKNSKLGNKSLKNWEEYYKAKATTK